MAVAHSVAELLSPVSRTVLAEQKTAANASIAKGGPPAPAERADYPVSILSLLDLNVYNYMCVTLCV